ncbi:MAG TPA: hypothetical protein VI233_01480, partial [Puia sp.]
MANSTARPQVNYRLSEDPSSYEVAILPFSNSSGFSASTKQVLEAFGYEPREINIPKNKEYVILSKPGADSILLIDAGMYKDPNTIRDPGTIFRENLRNGIHQNISEFAGKRVWVSLLGTGEKHGITFYESYVNIRYILRTFFHE